MTNENCTEFMTRLDEEYRQVTGLSERRFYSIFYSRVNPSPVMLLGFNPGGNPQDWSESQLASRSFYENGEHEYVDCHYPIAVAMRRFLHTTLNLTDEAIRSIPKSNVIFRRSTSQNGVSSRRGDLIHEAKPFLSRIIERVSPKIVICEGISTLDAFEKHYGIDVERGIDGVHVSTPNGRHRACIYRADRLRMSNSGEELTAIGIGHPSRYASRTEWLDVSQSAKQLLSTLYNTSEVLAAPYVH